ncbi:MAG: transglycosylase domain-containing protein, partial [Notoacmeibacter sp.]
MRSKLTEIPKQRQRTDMKRTSRFIAFDAWLDSFLYEARFGFSNLWETITIFSRRFHVSGWKRWLVELTGESFTLGVASAFIMLGLALPAFEATKGDWLKQDQIAVTFLDRFGNEIGSRGIIQRQSVPVAEMPSNVINAVLATEDRRFFSHIGIDFLGLVRAMTENARAGDVVQGGSTLTQQLAKNIFLTNERTVTRKINEAFLAIWLETNLTKSQIIQLYLDRAYMGGGTFGITAASDFYFGKSVKDVTLAEAAMLAGLFKAPAKYAPHINLPAARARANEVLNNMVEADFMTDAQVLAARRQPANIIDRERAKAPDYFLDWAFDEVKTLAANYPAPNYIVKTTLDTGIQEA